MAVDAPHQPIATDAPPGRRAADGMPPRVWSLRRFGTSPADLQVDLASQDRPRVVTDVLAACMLPSRDAGFYWDLPISTRTACLLTLAALDGVDAVDVEFRCPACSQPLELSLGIDELLEQEGRAGDTLTLVAGDGAVTELRRPTGRDQADWAAADFEDQRAWRRAIASRLSGGTAPLDDEMVGRIEEALDEGDPLLRAAVETTCPDCGAVSRHDVDLTACALQRLQRAQHRMIETVHELALRYHWSEAEILAMPSWRRERYLALLGREAGA